MKHSQKKWRKKGEQFRSYPSYRYYILLHTYIIYLYNMSTFYLIVGDFKVNLIALYSILLILLLTHRVVVCVCVCVSSLYFMGEHANKITSYNLLSESSCRAGLKWDGVFIAKWLDEYNKNTVKESMIRHVSFEDQYRS